MNTRPCFLTGENHIPGEFAGEFIRGRVRGRELLLPSIQPFESSHVLPSMLILRATSYFCADRRNIGERTAIVIFVLCTLNGERGGGKIIMVHTYICVRFQCDLNMYVVYLICLVSRDRKKIIVIILCTFGCDLKMWSKICWCVWFCDRGGKNIYIYLT